MPFSARAPFTVTFRSASFSKKYGSMIPLANRPHQTVVLSRCSWTSSGCYSSLSRQFCFWTWLLSQKWVYSLNKILVKYRGSLSSRQSQSATAAIFPSQRAGCGLFIRVFELFGNIANYAFSRSIMWIIRCSKHMKFLAESRFVLFVLCYRRYEYFHGLNGLNSKTLHWTINSIVKMHWIIGSKFKLCFYSKLLIYESITTIMIFSLINHRFIGQEVLMIMFTQPVVMGVACSHILIIF